MLWNIEKTEIIVKIYPLPEQNTDILEKNSESICLELFFKNVPFSIIVLESLNLCQTDAPKKKMNFFKAGWFFCQTVENLN